LFEGISFPQWFFVFDRIVNLAAAVQHISCGYWVRNGLSVINQRYNYKDPKFYEAMQFPDLHILQMGVCALGAEKFFSLLKSRFFPTPESLANNSCRESFLVLCIQILSCRKLISNDESLEEMKSNFDDSKVIEYELVQWLVLGDATFSSILKHFHDPLHSEEETIRRILTRIAHYRNPAGSSEGKFQLKDEYYQYFDPFFPKYEDSKKHDAELQYWSKRKSPSDSSKSNKTSDGFIQFLTLSAYPPLQSVLNLSVISSEFSEIRSLLVTSNMLEFFKDILQNYENQEYLPSIQYALRLISIGVFECVIKKSFSSEQEKSFLYLFDNLLPVLIFTLKHYNSLSLDASGSANVPSTASLIEWILLHMKNRDPELDAKIEPELNRIIDSQDAFRKEKTRKIKREKARAKALNDVQMKTKLFIQNAPEDLRKYLAGSSLIDEEKKSSFSSFECILCRSSEDANCIGLLSWTSRASVLRTTLPVSARCAFSADDQRIKSLDGPFVKFCGHAMHFTCKNAYLAGLNQKRAFHQNFEGLNIISPNDGEFLCPFCKGNVNGLIPISSNIDDFKNLHQFEFSSESVHEESVRLNSFFEKYSMLKTHSSIIDPLRRDLLNEFLMVISKANQPISISHHYLKDDASSLNDICDCIIYSVKSCEMLSRYENLVSEKYNNELRLLVLGCLESVDCMDKKAFLGFAKKSFEENKIFQIESFWASDFLKLFTKVLFFICAFDRELSNAADFKVELSELYAYLVKTLKDIISATYLKAKLLVLLQSWLSCTFEDLQNSFYDGFSGFKHRFPPISQLVEKYCSDNSIGEIEESICSPFIRQLELLLMSCGYISSDRDLEVLLGCSLSLLRRVPRDLALLGIESLYSSSLFSSVFPLRVGVLHAVPVSYDSLYNSLEGGSCGTCVSSRSVFICLMCGALLCSCRTPPLPGKGLLSSHCTSAGVNSCLFLDVRRSTVLALHQGYAGELVSPYLNRYGEEDRGLRLGLPLELNRDRWSRLHGIWLRSDIVREVSLSRSRALWHGGAPRRDQW
jgi:hypothetical protein